MSIFRRVQFFAILPFAFVPLIAISSEPISREWIERSLKDRPASQLEDVIARLPAEYRRSFTLVYQSRSQQAASRENPRAILYGPDARLILSFNGDPSQRGYDTIEGIQFRDQSARFEFFEIYRDDGGRIATRTGGICVFCHDGDPRPNWQPYAHWPGTFGSDDDQVQGALTPEGERGWLEAFMSKAGTHPRYRYLENLAEGYEPLQKGVPISRTRAMRNSTLSFRVSQLNFKRVSRILGEHPLYPKYRYALLGALACTPSLGLPLFFPESQRGGVPESGWGAGLEDGPGRSSPVRWLTRRLEMDWETLAMLSPGLQSRAFNDNVFNTGGSSEAEMTGALAKSDAGLAPWVRVIDYQNRSQGLRAWMGYVNDCARVAELSREALGH